MKSKNNSKTKYKNPLICPKCKSESVIKRGFRKTQNRGKIQRYSCRCCSHRFVEDEGFFRMRNNPKKISLSIDLFYRGLSTREVQNHLQAFYPHNSSNVSIYKWVTKYAKKISKFTDRLKVKTGSYIEIDEMEYHRRKSHTQKLGVDKNWFIDSIDVKTRFMICSTYAKQRNIKELKSVVKKIKDKSDKIKTITTDGLNAYPKVIKKVYGYSNKTHKVNVRHNRVIASKGGGFNIWVERMHGTIRQRTKTFRGLHGSVSSANALMRGIEIYYNFIRKHESLKGKTPSEVAIPELKFETPNRWLELIQMSSK